MRRDRKSVVFITSLGKNIPLISAARKQGYTYSYNKTTYITNILTAIEICMQSIYPLQNKDPDQTEISQMNQLVNLYVNGTSHCISTSGF